MTTPNPKCTRCKCYWVPDDTDIKSSGLISKSCKKCREHQKLLREKNKCQHNREKSRCKECGGGSICEHNKIKSRCKECGGGSICEHNKIKSRCKECGGSSICEHNKIKTECKECGGSAICKHNKYKRYCKECGGSGICQHNKLKHYCKECGGGSICEHNKIKSKCKECGGGSICEHNKIKTECKECGGSAICEHNKYKRYCKECGGSGICQHNKLKHYCKECNFKLYLIHLQRGSLRRLLSKTDVVKKTKPSIEYLGCSAEYFIEHIEKQFKDGMTWDNIHLDHIKPVSKFDLDDEEEFLLCCNYKNFQPLLAKDNLEKSNKFTEEDEIKWQKLMELEE